jgi:hypothetical protein
MELSNMYQAKSAHKLEQPTVPAQKISDLDKQNLASTSVN